MGGDQRLPVRRLRPGSRGGERAHHAVLARVADAVAKVAPGKVGVAGQDLYWEASGAFTGQLNASMLQFAGAKWVIVGHSERRQFFGMA